MTSFKDGWETHPGSWHCFKAYSKPRQRAEADRKCKSHNAYLVTIYGDGGNAWIQEVMTSSPDGHLDVAWIGAQVFCHCVREPIRTENKWIKIHLGISNWKLHYVTIHHLGICYTCILL